MFEVPDEITNVTRSLKWSRHKYSYIGRLHLYIGMVPSDSGIFPEYREVTGTPREKLWALWAIRGKHTIPQGAGVPPLGRRPIRTRRRGSAPLSFSFSLPPFLLRVGGGILLGLGSPSRTPHLGAPPRVGRLSLSLLYIRRQGAPQRHTSWSFSHVRCPPPQLHTSVISS